MIKYNVAFCFLATALFYVSPSIAADFSIKNETLQKGYFLLTDNLEKCLSEPAEEGEILDACICVSDIKYPRFSGMQNKELQDSLNKHFKNFAAKIACEGKKTKKPENIKGRTADAELSFEKTFEGTGYISLKQREHVYSSGAAHDLATEYGTIINVNKGHILKITDIFGNDKENYEAINKFIDKKNLERQCKLLDNCSQNYMPTAQLSPETNITGGGCGISFYIDKNSRLKAIFNPYVIGSFADGIIEFEIPKKFVTNKELSDILRE